MRSSNGLARDLSAAGLVALTVIGCGSKSALLEPSANGAATAGSGGAGSGGASSGGTSSGGAGSGGLAGAGGVPEVKCLLSPAASPEELLSFPEGNTDTPLMAVLDSGASGSAKIAYCAISQDANFWHPELRIAELTVASDSAAISKPPILYGFDSHAWGKLVRRPGPGAGVALAFYHSDEASPNVDAALKFRSFDTAAWKPGPELKVDATGTVVYGFVAGAGIGGASFGGEGYAVAYRSVDGDGLASPLVTILDAAGNPAVSPLSLAAAEKYPGRVADVAWTGQSYLAAVSFAACPSKASGCVDDSVIVSRLSPLGSTLSAVATAGVPVSTPGSSPLRPVLASNGTVTWLVWSEASPEPAGAPRTVRMARLSAQGELLGEPVTVAQDVHPSHAVSALVTSFGLIVWWGEPADDSLPSNAPGHSKVVIHQYSSTGNELHQLELPATELAYGVGPSLVTLDSKLGAVVSWGAQSESEAKSVAWLARLRCLGTP